MNSERVLRNWSMSNLLKINDLVFWEPVHAQDIRFGELVAFQGPAELTMHRAITKGRSKGDWLLECDGRMLAEWDVLGRVVSIRRGSSQIYCRTRSPIRNTLSALLSMLGGNIASRTHRYLYLPFRLLLRIIWLNSRHNSR